MKVIEYAQQMGLDIIQGDHEDAPGQLELNTQFDDVLRNADRLTTFRQICAQVARENNLIACFMSKPFMGVSANGCHHNMSLWRGGEDVVNMLGFDSLSGMKGLSATGSVVRTPLCRIHRLMSVLLARLVCSLSAVLSSIWVH
jgi:glutamine synthetase